MLALTAPATADPRSQGPKPKKSKDERRADLLVEQGKVLGEEGHPEQALEKFREAERVFPRAAHLCNIGIAYDTMGNLPLALLYLERCREKAQTFPKWLAAKHGEVIAELTRTHAPVEIRVRPRKAKIRVSALGSNEPVSDGERVFLARGEWTIVARRKGYQTREAVVSITNLAGQRIDLALEREPGGPEETDVEAEEDSGGGGARAGGWILIAAGAAAAATGGLFHYRSNRARDEARDLPPGPDFDERDAAYRRDGWIAVGAYGTGAVCVGVGLYLLLRSNDGASEDDPAVALAVGGGDFMLSLSFAR